MLKRVGWPLTIVALAGVGYLLWTHYGLKTYHHRHPDFSIRVKYPWTVTETGTADGGQVVFKDAEGGIMLAVSYRQVPGLTEQTVSSYADYLFKSFGFDKTKDYYPEKVNMDGTTGYLLREKGRDPDKPATVIVYKGNYFFYFESAKQRNVLRATDAFKSSEG